MKKASASRKKQRPVLPSPRPRRAREKREKAARARRREERRLERERLEKAALRKAKREKAARARLIEERKHARIERNKREKKVLAKLARAEALVAKLRADAKPKRNKAKGKKAKRDEPKRTAPKRKAPLFITLNGTRLGRASGITEWMSGKRLLGFTKILLEDAILRRNGKRFSVRGNIRLTHGDEITLRRRRHTKKEERRRKKRPGPRRTKMGQSEIIRLPDGTKIGPDEWVKAFSEEWLKYGGGVAAEMSFVRCDPRAETWYKTMKYLAYLYGVEGKPFKDYMKEIAELTGRPLYEVYTLFRSH